MIINEIRDGNWRDLLPVKWGNHHFINDHLDYGNLPQSIRDRILFFQCIAKGAEMGEEYPTVSYRQVKEYFSDAEEILNIFSADFLYPPTEDSWKSMVRLMIEQESVQGVSVLAGLSPHLVESVVLDYGQEWHPSALFSWLSVFMSPSLNVPKIESLDLDSEKIKNVSIDEPQIEETDKWLRKIALNLEKGSWESAVKREWFDGKLKWKMMPGETKNLQDWLLKSFIPALSRLSLDQMKIIVEFWPMSKTLDMDSLSHNLSSSVFWGTVKKMPEAEKMFFLESLLPKILNKEAMSFDEKFALATSILEWTVKNPILFNQRLKLWCSLGGNLDEEPVTQINNNPNKVDDTLFSSGIQNKVKTVRDWILSKNNEMWSKELEKNHPMHIRSSKPKV